MLLGIIYSCVHFIAASSGQQMEIKKSSFNKCLSDAYRESSTGASDEVWGRRLVNSLRFSSTMVWRRHKHLSTMKLSVNKIVNSLLHSNFLMSGFKSYTILSLPSAFLPVPLIGKDGVFLFDCPEFCWVSKGSAIYPVLTSKPARGVWWNIAQAQPWVSHELYIVYLDYSTVIVCLSVDFHQDLGFCCT